MDLELDGKVAIVTGAASPRGIGNAIARALAEEGVTIAVTDIAAAGIEQFVDELQADGHKAMACVADQSDHEQVMVAVNEVVSSLGQVDILVNCASITSNNLGTLARMPVDKFNHEIDVSLKGPYHWIREVLPTMRTQNWGRILNISSVRGLFGGIGVPGYSVAKGGLHTLTYQTARENASRGITANCLVLGVIDTDIYRENDFDPKEIEWLKAHIPIRRIGSPDEVGSVAAFLCSMQAGYVTGSLVSVDGGMHISI